MLRLPYRDNHSVLAEKFSAQLQCSSRTVHSICEDKAGLGEQGRSIKIPYEHRRQSQRGTFIKCPHASTHTSANYPHRGGETVSFLQHRLLTDHKEKNCPFTTLVSVCLRRSIKLIRQKKKRNNCKQLARRTRSITAQSVRVSHWHVRSFNHQKGSTRTGTKTTKRHGTITS